MNEWQKTGCVLCAQNCGVEVLIEDNRIVKVRPDRDNPRSEGYICRKGMNIAYHQHNKDRLKYPLKKTKNGFERISWDQAATEIAEKLKGIVDTHGPESFAYMGGGGQGCHFEAAFGMRLLNALGSKYYYSALGQELTGAFWAYGRLTGKQYLFAIPDEKECDMLLGIGWNGYVSHQMCQAPRVLNEISSNPDKLLVIIDPRESETAKKADIHLAIRPGTDALLTKAMIAIILQNDWHNREYIEKHVSGFDIIEHWFKDFDSEEAVKVCELDFETVKKVCHEFATRKSCMHPDLGILMNRHSTATSYLEGILLAICGRLCVPGGNIIPGHIMPLGAHTDERNPKTWRTVETNFPALLGTFPPAVMPEEILSDKPKRQRALLCSQSNPLRSYPDTKAYEQAFDKLELLVVCELAMTETAQFADYILPARSGYESWDSTFFPWTFPEIFFQMRRPLVKPDGEQLEVSQIITLITDKLGLIPDIPDSLYEAAKKNRLSFGAELMKYGQENPASLRMMNFVVAKTLGKEMGSANLSALWALLQMTPKSFRENAVRAGFEKGPLMGDQIFQSLLDHPEGIWVGKCDPDDNFSYVKNEDNRVNVYAAEMEGWIAEITPENEKKELDGRKDYPLILNAGRHTPMNANTLMRNPEWNSGKRACTLAMHPQDADRLSLTDGENVKIVTEAGEETIELEITNETRKGVVIIPHGFGLDYNGNTYGINVNSLVKSTNRDRFAATPYHRYVPCRVEPLN